MATLALSLAGQVVGGAFGGPIGATIGRALGALAGSAVDSAIFSEKPQATGADVRVQGSSEGAPIPRLYGWSRLSGNIIWATDLELLGPEDSGAKATAGGEDAGVAASFALGLCEGEVYRLGRIWADGQLLATEGLTLRFYRGTETQVADSLIEATHGDDAPAYRGLCYLVFERLPLKPFGNRIPNITVELCRVVGELEPMIKAVTVIPGATEFGYDPTPRVRLVGSGVTALENTHLSAGTSDWTLSIDELVALCPNLEHVALVVAWFGDDVRAGHCTIRPKVEAANRTVKGTAWEVAGLTRAGAQVVSTHDGGPAYGGTPSDAAVLAAIADLKARGIGVTLYPIVLMDIPAGNALGQPAYPWRGRIAPEAADGSTGVADEIEAFVGDGSGWDFRRFILHYADLAHDAGGVDAMLLCSELRGLSFARGPGNSFPFVDELVDLAADVKAIVASDGTKLTYGADWSEYSGLQPGGGARFFHLDQLWASPDIDAVGIDNYMPVADWRDGGGPDAALADSPYDASYLDANVEGGEGYDWYYVSEADRTAGTRTPITDGAHGEPWVWRFKDIAGWWSNAHHNRPGGVRDASPTAWVPGSKPIWFTELGCGAVDRGGNQPNLFSDKKSSEDGKPYFSNGVPDVLEQRQVLRALLSHWADSSHNLAAPAYGGRMLERTYLWTWDARPWPAFPEQLDSWSDGANYASGHWLTGRLGAMASDELARAVAADFGVGLEAAEASPPLAYGYVVEGPTTARAALEPLLSATGLEVRDTAEGLVLARATGREPVVIANVVAADGPMVARRRPDPGEAVAQVALSYVDRERGYLAGSATAIADRPGMLEAAGLPLVLDLQGARTTAERLLHERQAKVDTLEVVAPPSMLALEVGDAIAVTGGVFEVTSIRDGVARQISAAAIPDAAPASVIVTERPRPVIVPAPQAEPVVAFAELPPSTTDVMTARLAMGAFASPWPGNVQVTDEGTGATVATVGSAATLGELTAPLAVGGIWTWDETNAVELVLYGGHLSSRSDNEVLAGANRIAIASDAGAWEVIGFASADLIGPRTYRLTRLLRGQWGSDYAIGSASTGNRVLVLDSRATVQTLPGEWLDTTVSLRSFAGRTDAVGEETAVAIALAPVLPLAPVHLAAARDASGDVSLSWMRRSRSDTDSWAGDDAPLDCAPEAYRVTIYNGVSVARTVDVSMSVLTYTAAQQAADFGVLPASFSFTVAQRSAPFGSGHAAPGQFTA